MDSSLVYNYYILWLHLINMTFRLFYSHKLTDFQIIKFEMSDINNYLNSIFTSNFIGEAIFDNGSIDILTVIVSLTAFFLGKFYENSWINFFISSIIFEILIIYNKKEGRLLNTLIFFIIFYLIGTFLRKDKKLFLLEKNLTNKNIYDEINTQEYGTYKLY